MPRQNHGVIRCLVAITLLATTAGAQIVRRAPAPRRQPNWAGASVGITQGFTVLDGSTGSTWDFGSGLAFAGRFERPTGSGAFAVGAQASFARLPLAYSSSSFSSDAKADVMELMAVLRYGGGYGFHPVYELAGGLMRFSNFQSTGTTSVSISTSSDYDPKFSLGYGFGFGLSPTASIEVVQELGTILHQKTGLSASQSNYPRIYITRIGGKLAF